MSVVLAVCVLCVYMQFVCVLCVCSACVRCVEDVGATIMMVVALLRQQRETERDARRGGGR